METYLTREGFEKLRLELGRLKKLKPEITLEVEEARAQGDLKENVGYTASKEKLTEIVRRIGEIEQKLLQARLVEELNISTDEIRIGAKVSMTAVESGDEFVYTLVGSDEADPSEGRLSVHSPLAQGILGHKVGEKVKVALPAGEKVFKIVKVKYG